MKQPRSNKYAPVNYGRRDTWLESEDYCFPSGGMTRYCCARHYVTGKLIVVRCGLSDTLFSIPTASGGWIGLNNETFCYYPPKGQTT